MGRGEEETTMKRTVSVLAGMAVLALPVAVALAMGPGGRGGMGMMGMMGQGDGPMKGRGWMGSGYAPGMCPGMAGTQTAPAALSAEGAKEIAQEYADRYLEGFTVERALPFVTPGGTGYSVELKGPNDQLRTLHVNPWGNVMPFGGPGRRGS
jgi:hypothetical protein